MDVTFVYQNKQITTPNLEKKLKRMGITKDDIKIIDTPIKKKEKVIYMYPIEDYYFIKETPERWSCHICKTPPKEYDVDYTEKQRKIMYETTDFKSY